MHNGPIPIELCPPEDKLSHPLCQMYGDREGPSSVHLVLSWPQDINSWERHIMTWPQDHFVKGKTIDMYTSMGTTSISRGHEFNV